MVRMKYYFAHEFWNYLMFFWASIGFRVHTEHELRVHVVVHTHVSRIFGWDEKFSLDMAHPKIKFKISRVLALSLKHSTS